MEKKTDVFNAKKMHAITKSAIKTSMSDKIFKAIKNDILKCAQEGNSSIEFHYSQYDEYSKYKLEELGFEVYGYGSSIRVNW